MRLRRLRRLPAHGPPLLEGRPVGRPPASFRIPHGSAALIEARLPETPETASFHWQTNGMGALWWEAPAEVSTGAVSVVWTPAMDAGADDVRAFFRIAQEAGPDYSAFANLRLLPSPGAEPNALPLPAPFIDFATVAATNAPWATPDDVSAAVAAAAPGDYAAVSNAAMSALQAEADPAFREWAGTNDLFSAVGEARSMAGDALAGFDVLDRWIGQVQAEAGAIGPAATNYVDAVAGALGANFDVILPAIGTIGPAATNYTDSAVSGVVASAERAAAAGVTNRVAEALAELGADWPAAELHKLILADLWRRVDALEGSDGSGWITAADAEALWADRLEAASTNAFWYLRNAAAAGAELFRAQLSLVQPRAPTNLVETVFAGAKDVTLSIPLDSGRAGAYASTEGVRLGIVSFTGLSLNPAWVELRGWSEVAWPEGAVLAGARYDPEAAASLFRVQQVGGAVVVEGVAASAGGGAGQ